MILHDLRCSTCNLTLIDFFLPCVPDTILHATCGGTFDIIYENWRKRGNAQWGSRDASVVFRNAQGHIRYPGRNDTPTPPGHERVEIRNLADMTRFERKHDVTCEAMHFNKNSDGFVHDGRPVAAPKWAASNKELGFDG